jgi:hypothetical protein
MGGKNRSGTNINGTDQHHGVAAIITPKNSASTQKCLTKKPLEEQDRDGKIILKVNSREKLETVRSLEFRCR